MNQVDMFSKPYEPHFNGPEYVAKRDWTRLSSQIGRVFQCMKDGHWRSLKDIASITSDPEASISAQLRHLRKDRFGSHTVEKKHLGSGYYHYRLLPNGSKGEINE